MSDAPLVLVTGASGYIAGHVIQKLLDSNQYRVRGSVRSVEKWKQRLTHLKREEHKHELELVYGDLTEEKGWADAVKDCTYIIHMASPFPLEVPKDREALVRPAVSGVEFVFKAAIATKTVKRIVITSSCAAIYPGNRDKPADYVFTEKDWAQEDTCTPYDLSKTRAEKRAWELVKGTDVECVAINPALVVGPLQSDNAKVSVGVIKMILMKEQPMLANMYMGVVDVRDVADAHIRAMTADGAAGNRYVCVDTTLALKDIGDTLHKEFGKNGYCPPTTVAPNFLIKVMGICDSTIRDQVVPVLGFCPKFDSSKAKQDLKLEFTPAAESIIATCYSMIEHGVVPDRRKRK